MQKDRRNSKDKSIDSQILEEGLGATKLGPQNLRS